MLGLVFVVAFVAAIVLLPLLIVAVVLRAFLGLVGFAAKLTVGLVLGTVGLAIGIVFCAIALLIAGAALLIPLLPLILAAGAAWMLWRLVRRSRTAARVLTAG